MKRNSFLLLIIILFSLNLFAKERKVTCPRKYPQTIRVPFNDVMVLAFPEKPKHSLPGKTDFDFQYIGNDIGIKGLVKEARANMFVYLGKSRCAFKLVSTTGRSDDIVTVRYPKEKTVEVKYVK